MIIDENRVIRVFATACTLAVLGACGNDGTEITTTKIPSVDAGAPPASSSSSAPLACVGRRCQPEPSSTYVHGLSPTAPQSPLQIEFLGVDGFLLSVGNDTVMTAPLFTRPDIVTVETGLPTKSDPTLVDANLPTTTLANVRAVLAGHAHYDHLLDVPTVLERASQATLFTNASAQNLLDAYAPDREPVCSTSPAPAFTIPRDRVVAMDDPAASVVDYTNCPDQKPAGAPLAGTWVDVPNANVRLYAVCSMHPNTIGPIHYAPGDVDTEQCTPPTSMPDWKEGSTIAFLVDFLDPNTAKPIFRIYYQDAPTNAPIGHVPPAVLADKGVDLALLCVGSYDQVTDMPTATIAALAPRFVLGGHWENFFQPMTAPIAPIPLLDVGHWSDLARIALPDGLDPQPIVMDGTPTSLRAIVPNPGDEFQISP